MPSHHIALIFTLILPVHVYKGLLTGFFLSGFTTKTLYEPLLYPVCTTCPTYLILLDVITCIIFGEEYRL